MAATIKIQGIIIDRRAFGEADRILTILTLNQGKIEAIAKAVRRPHSKLGGHLELFYIVDFILAPGRTWYIVTEAQLVKRFPVLYNNLDLAQTAGYLGRLIKLTFQPGEPHPKIYRSLLDSLQNLAQAPDMLTLCFEWNLLKDLGYWPELTKCVCCENNIDIENLAFAIQDGGLVCSDCRKDYLSLHLNTVKIIRLFANINPAQVIKIKVNDQIIKELKTLTRLFLEYNLGRGPKVTAL